MQRQELDLGSYTNEVTRVLDQELDLNCTTSERCLPQIATIISAHAVDLDGNPVPPAVAAERIVALLERTRVSGAAEEEPLGVVVTTDVELAGLRGEPVLLSWSMWQRDGDTRLYGDWLNENLAYRLEATTEQDTTTLDLWIPLPREPGPYIIRVQLTTAGSPLASADSDPFE